MKKNDRNVPVSSRMTNDHSAISPSRNDQWSGKTFRRNTRSPRAPWNLSSSHDPVPLSALGISTVSLTARLPSSPLPETGADGLGEVALGHQVALRVDGHGQLRQRPRRRAEDHGRAGRRVERGLVARA